jgi:tetratricopeptide (TPR) repeat protein
MLNAGRLAQSLGRFDQAIALDQYVTAHDPVNARAHYNLGFDYYLAGRRDDAIASWRTTLALSPGYIGAWYNIAVAQLHAGQAEAALESMRREPPGIWQMIGMPMVYHALAKNDEADAALSALIKAHAQDSAYNIAYVYALQGDSDQAFTWLDRAVANSDPGLSDLALEPDFNSLHKDPRWLPLLEKLGKSPAQLAAIKFEPALPQ